MKALLHGGLPVFLLQAIAVIGLSRLLGLLTRRIQQPLVIAEISAGIILGPSLLGWLSPGAMTTLFPKESMALLGLTSQAGLLLFMFIVGLELDPRLLSSRVKSSIAISHSSIVVPFVLGSGLALYLHPRLKPANVSLTSFVLFMGVAMSITAFPVLARILVDRRLLRTRVGAVAIACAAVDDVTAWCILAFVVSIARSAGLGSAVRTVALAVGTIVVAVFVLRPYLARLASWNRGGLTQNLVALVIICVFVSSFTTELIGIHALFGAFLFGAILPKNGTMASALAEKIEDVVVVVLLPLFFAYSGLRTQIGLLDSAGSWAITGAITIVACVGKFGGSAVAARVTGIPWREASAIGILMNTRGLMELIVLNVGLELGVISPTLFTMMVLMALATTFMTTPLLHVVYPMATVVREIDEQEAAAAAAVAPPVSRLLRRDAFTILCVPLDNTGTGIVAFGAALAARSKPEPRIYLLHLVTSASRPSFVIDQHREEAAASGSGDPLVAYARTRNLPLRVLSFVSTNPASDICAVAEVKHADLVVLGTSSGRVGGALLGGVVHEVMETSTARVAVFVDRGLEEIRRVLVPYDRSEHGVAALQLAGRVAQSTGAHVTVVDIVAPSASAATVDERSARREIHAGLSGAELPAFEILVKTIRDAATVDALVAETGAGYDLLIVGKGKTFGLEAGTLALQSEPLLSRIATSAVIVRSGGDALAEVSPEAQAASHMRFATLEPPPA